MKFIRASELAQLVRQKNWMVVGVRGIGKTTLLREFIKHSDKLAIYLDLDVVGLTPEHFCIAFIEAVCSAYLGKKVKFSDLLSLDIPPASKELIASVDNELQKIKPDQQYLVELGLKFSDKLGQEVDRQLVLCMDEFWKIKQLDNFSQIGDIIGIFKRIAHPCTTFILTGSQVWLSKQIARQLGYKVLELKGLSLDQVKQLVSHDEKLVLKLTQGIPLYINAISSAPDINQAFRDSLNSADGLIFNHLSFMLTESLARARGQSLLYVILKILARSDKLKLAELSSKLYRSTSVTKSLLDRLIEVDLVAKQGSYYYMPHKILKQFIKNE